MHKVIVMEADLPINQCQMLASPTCNRTTRTSFELKEVAQAVNMSGSDNLRGVALAGNIELLYESIEKNANVLEDIDGIPFVHTPLHVAAANGHTQFALEMMNLKPSFGKKLNPEGLSPLHLALQNHHPETAARLVKIDSELIRVKGKESFTPLHRLAALAKSEDYMELLAEFLCACPASINDLTIRQETALHIAVKERNFKAFKVLFEWVWRTYNRQVLKWTDGEGNALFHLAVLTENSTDQTEIVKLLVEKGSMLKNQKNSKGFTALDIASERGSAEIRNILHRAKAKLSDDHSCLGNNQKEDLSLLEYLSSPEQFHEPWLRCVLYWRRDLSMQMRNVVLVVAVLIATATFQAVPSPRSGGSSPGGDTSGTTTKSTIAATNPLPYIIKRVVGEDGVFFLVFYVLNTIAFTASIMVIILVLQWRPFSALLHASLIFVVTSYGISLFHLLSSPWAAGYLTILSCTCSLLCYCVKSMFWNMEMHMKSDMLRNFGFFWMPLPRGIKQRLQILQRLMSGI